MFTENDRNTKRDEKFENSNIDFVSNKNTIDNADRKGKWIEDSANDKTKGSNTDAHKDSTLHKEFSTAKSVNLVSLSNDQNTRYAPNGANDNTKKNLTILTGGGPLIVDKVLLEIKQELIISRSFRKICCSFLASVIIIFLKIGWTRKNSRRNSFLGHI